MHSSACWRVESPLFVRSHRLPSPLPDLLVELPKFPFQPVLGIDTTILIKCRFLRVLSTFKDSLLHWVQGEAAWV